MRVRPLSESYRRRALDRDLNRACASLRGLVLDLGGERLNRRGAFEIPSRADLQWLCLNLDPAVAPDIVSDVGRAPLRSACADAIVCTEVLEHVPHPRDVVTEAFRLLRPGGRLIASMPFIMRVHGDPYDYQRYTASKLGQLLMSVGFDDVSIRSQGLFFSVLADMIRGGLAEIGPRPLRWLLALLVMPVLGLSVCYESRVAQSDFVRSYVSGYFILGRKPTA